MKTTTAVGIVGSIVVNAMLGLVIATVFSVTPAAQAREAAHRAPHLEQVAGHAAPEHARGGGPLTAVRMGWTAG